MSGVPFYFSMEGIHTGTLVAFSVNMTTKVSGCQYDLRVKCQVEIYLKPVYRFLTFLVGCSYLAQ